MISGSKNCIIKLFFKVVVRIQNLYRAMFQILTIHWYIRLTILLFVRFFIYEMTSKLNEFTSCGGTSNETVLRSTFLYESTHGMTKNKPGPFAPPDLKRPNRKTTALSYSCTTYPTTYISSIWDLYYALCNIHQYGYWYLNKTHLHCHTERKWHCDENQDKREHCK